MSTHDWAKADIIAAVRKSGTSLRQLSINNGLCEKACSTALHRPYKVPEQLIAEAINVPPHVIWPSRYDTNGVRRRFLHSKMVPESKLKDAAPSISNVQTETAKCPHGGQQ